ncbi:hypothetical protein [Shinella sumterensis]|uniref:Uncharacterized protein n=1 Tax=Shinella sumterensis TaxID=1967501 RepID=A0AA50HB82_9HYPH|nr:hypothetical protein [Shinella sumterensis]WLS00760.1 hypothetical protein Q9313_24690 [Shinella sumterensis]
MKQTKPFTVEVRKVRRWKKYEAPSLWGDLDTKPHADAAELRKRNATDDLEAEEVSAFPRPHPLRD